MTPDLVAPGPNILDMQSCVDVQGAACEATSTAKMMWPAVVEEFVSKRIQKYRGPPYQWYLPID